MDYNSIVRKIYSYGGEIVYNEVGFDTYILQLVSEKYLQDRKIVSGLKNFQPRF